MRAKDRTGVLGEELAADFLTAQGHTVLQRRWRCPRGEIDLITADGSTLVTVEVKTRRGVGYGHPFEAVTGEKLRRLQRLSLDYLAETGSLSTAHRIDVVSVLLGPQSSPGSSACEAQPPQFEHLKDVRL